MLRSHQIDSALYEFLCVDLDEIDRLKAMFFHEVRKSAHPAPVVLCHKAYFRLLLKRAQTCDRYSQVARNRFMNSSHIARTLVGITEGARNILLWAADFMRVRAYRYVQLHFS